MAEERLVGYARGVRAPPAGLGSAAGSWTWWPRRSPTPPKPNASPLWRKPPTARPGWACGGSGTAPPGSPACSPTPAATRLATYLEAFTTPREGPRGPRPGPDPGRGPARQVAVPAARRGLPATCLEVLDPSGSRSTAGTRTTLFVTIPLDQLRTGLGAARSSPPTSPATTTAATSPPAKPAFWPATRASSRRPRRAVGDPRPGPRREAVHPGPAQGPAPPRPDLPRRGLPHPRHLVRSPPLEPLADSAGRPTSTTVSCSADTTTTASTKRSTTPNASPPATSDTTDADRPPWTGCAMSRRCHAG